MTFFSFELLGLLICIFIILNFKFNQKMTIKILKDVVIYLPPNEKDYEYIEKLKKDKVKGGAIVRTCKVEEYLNVITEDNTTDGDVMVFFYMTTLIGLVVSEVGKIVKRYTTNTNETTAESVTAIDTFDTVDIVASFSFIAATYLMHLLFKITFKQGYKTYEAKTFYFIFAAVFVSSAVLLFFFDNLIHINSDSICGIVNDRMNRITNKAKENNIDIANISICSHQTLQMFYAFVFAFVCGLLYRACTRLSIFDGLLSDAADKTVTLKGNLNKTNEEDATKKSLSNIKAVQTKSKVSRVLNIIILFTLVDPLLFTVLVKEYNISELYYYLFIPLPLLLIELFIQLQSIKYYSILFLNQNYYTMIDFCDRPNKDYLPYLKQKLSYLNSKYWEIYMQLFYTTFFPSLLCLFFLSSGGAADEIFNGKKYKGRISFLDTFAYFSLLGVVFSKAVITNLYSYYQKNITDKQKGAIFI